MSPKRGKSPTAPACPCIKHTSSTLGCALTFADARPDRRSKRWAELLPWCSSEIPLDRAVKKKKKKAQTSPLDVKCPLRASPGQELCARLRSQKGGICHLVEVMTHAAVLLHLHRPSPRKCRRGGAPGAARVAGRKKPARPWGARQPRARCGGGRSWLRLPGRSARSGRRQPAGEEHPGDCLSCGPQPSAVSSVCVRGVLRGRRALFRGCVRKYRGLVSVTEFMQARS